MDQREIVLYTRERSLRCWRARRFLRRTGYRFEVVDSTEGQGGMLAELSEAFRCEMVAPYVFVDHRPVGSLRTVRTLVGSGQFEHLVRGEL